MPKQIYKNNAKAIYSQHREENYIFNTLLLTTTNTCAITNNKNNNSE